MYNFFLLCDPISAQREKPSAVVSTLLLATFEEFVPRLDRDFHFCHRVLIIGCEKMTK